jgi:ApbE superfamily uncharacterized protein (UPF0280 family)
MIVRHRLYIKETIATLIAEEKFIPVAEEEVRLQRKNLQEYIRIHPEFLTSLTPCLPLPGAPDIVQDMADRASRVGVGPMAAVAGAIAEHTVKAMIDRGASHVIFDNGGDIAMFIDFPVVVGIYAGRSGIKNLGFEFEPEGRIIGICTSSATVGHSLSFGRADAAIVISPDVMLADVAATALGNATSSAAPGDIHKSLDHVMTRGITGMMAIIGESIGFCGELPAVCFADVDCDLISRGNGL